MATHADMVVRWMSPVAANVAMDESRWQTTGRVVMCSVLGGMATLIVHPDIKSAVRRAAFIPKHWAAYLNAFADIREHYVVVPACTFEDATVGVDRKDPARRAV